MEQYFIYKKNQFEDEVYIRLINNKFEIFSIDGTWQNYEASYNLKDLWIEISKEKFWELIKKRYRFYLYQKGQGILVRVVNDAVLQIYDVINDDWKNAPNNEWLKNIMLEGDDDFSSIDDVTAETYIKSKKKIKG